jgi:FG-GAP-like repeat/Abnormal spindle-like microcephaly-assoc'd, ASPM-SPD-2-Hydin
VPSRQIVLTLLFVSLMSALSLAQFETRFVNSLSPNPWGDTVADLNHDGKLDIVVTNCGLTFQISVMLGNGDGTFQPAVNYLLPNCSDVPAVGDFNGDGNPDLAVANGNGSVSVLLGNGDGTFQPAVSYPTQLYAQGVQVGDFNNDGKLDLVMCGSQWVTVLLGNGDGTFQAPIPTTPPDHPNAIGVGDFNHDGKLDVVATQEYGTAQILFGNGDGTFTYVGSHSVPNPTDQITMADVNHDGNLDLITTGETSLSVSLGNADGTFRPAAIYAPIYPEWTAVADFNGDGNPDIAVAIFGFISGFTIMNGNGDGTFQNGSFNTIGYENRFIAAGDFNGDGQPDIALPSYGTANIAILLNTGVVAFSPLTPINFPSQLVGTVSDAQTVTLTNNGTRPLTISSIKAKGLEFAMSSTCGKTVAAGGACQVSVTFSPKSQGEELGTVNISDSASSKPQVISLVGDATVVQLSPTSLNFGSVPVGSKSAPQNIQITNTGQRALTITKVSLAGFETQDYAESNNCPSSLGPGASCIAKVTFTPTKTGPRSAGLQVVDNGGASPQTAPFSGTGS